MPQSSFETLSKEVDQLGHLIGDVIREMAGDDGFELVEAVRKMIRELRAGNREREDELDSIIANVDKAQIITLTQAFTIFLELSNLAEDRQRVRVLFDRRRERIQSRRKRRFGPLSSDSTMKECPINKFRISSIRLELNWC